MNRVAIYWNTVRYLKPVQVCSRILKFFKSRERRYDIPAIIRDTPLSIFEIDTDETFCNRFNVDGIQENVVCLLNQEVKLDYTYEYTHKLKPLIYNNVYYFEYAVVLGAYYKKTGDTKYIELFAKLYSRYVSSNADVKSPYIMSLHIPNILIALDMFGNALDGEIKKRISVELYSQYCFLQSHLETHLLANHYFENLKALTIASYYFGDDKKCRQYLKKIHKECEEQILPDGFHFELSPMYNKLIIEDLLRIAKLFPQEIWIKDKIQKLVNAAYTVEKGIGRTPLFNDSGDNVAKPLDSLIKAAQSVCGIVPCDERCLPDAGYYKMYDGRISMVIDAGSVGVDYQPAHGHSDCLSYELSIDKVPIIVNQGTYEYQGNRRQKFRRTMAHNTAMIDKHEQNQFWAGFRVGKRIKNVSGSLGNNCFEGSYINCYGETHVRRICLKNSALEVLDTFSKGHSVASYIHLAPGLYVDKNRIKKNEKTIAIIDTINSTYSIEKDGGLNEYACEFGKIENSVCVVFSWERDGQNHGYRIYFSVDENII